MKAERNPGIPLDRFRRKLPGDAFPDRWPGRGALTSPSVVGGGASAAMVMLARCDEGPCGWEAGAACDEAGVMAGSCEAPSCEAVLEGMTTVVWSWLV